MNISSILISSTSMVFLFQNIDNMFDAWYMYVFSEGIQPDIEVHRLSFSEKNSDGERFSLDEQSQTRMNVCDEPDQEA